MSAHSWDNSVGRLLITNIPVVTGEIVCIGLLCSLIYHFYNFQNVTNSLQSSDTNTSATNGSKNNTLGVSSSPVLSTSPSPTGSVNGGVSLSVSGGSGSGASSPRSPKSPSSASSSNKKKQTNNNNKNKKKIHLRFRIISICGISFFIITLFCYFYAETFTFSVVWGFEPYALVSLFWGHGNLFSYLLYVQRINTAFAKTSYNASKRTFILLYCGIFFVYFCQLYIVLFFFLGFYGAISLELMSLQLNIANDIEIFVQLVISFSLTKIFISKLIKLEASYARNNGGSSSSSGTKEKDNNNNKNKNFEEGSPLLFLATRQAVLSMFGALSTCVWLVTAAVMIFDWLLFPESPGTIKHIFHHFTGFGLVFDCVSNSFAIFLSFKFAKQYYIKGCISCHRDMHQFVEARAEKKLHKK